MRPRYYVSTWDSDLQEFTPQVGVRTGPYCLGGLRKALRKLAAMGYDVKRKGAVSVLVERDYDWEGRNAQST